MHGQKTHPKGALAGEIIRLLTNQIFVFDICMCCSNTESHRVYNLIVSARIKNGLQIVTSYNLYKLEVTIASKVLKNNLKHLL
jgi:hypothetical protein